MPLMQWGTYTPDVTDYESNASNDIINVIPQGDGYAPFPDFASVSTALSGACRGGFYAIKSDGTVVVFAGTATKLYSLNNTTYGWTDVSLGSSTYSALTSTANWQFAQFGNLVFATQANAVLQVFDLSSSTNFANSAGSPPQAAYVSVVGRFLVLSGLLSNPYRIQWSGLNATTTWTSGVNSSDFQDFPDGGIVRGVAGGEFGTIFQDQAIRRMAYIPGSAFIFQIERVTQDMGLLAPYSIVRAGSTIYFYAGQGFYKIESGQLPTQIGRERIDRTFLLDLDKSNLQLFIGASDPRTSRVYWSYKSVAGVANAYDKIIGYDSMLDRFFQVSMTGEYLMGISQTGLTLENLDSISGSIDALTLTLDAYPTAVQPEISQFSSAHQLGFFRGPNLESQIESGEQGTDGDVIYTSGFRPITDAMTVYGKLSWRQSQATTPTFGTEQLMSVRTGLINVRREARYIRFRQRIPYGTVWTFSSGIEIQSDISGKT